MIVYAKVINEVTKACDVGAGDNYELYSSLGMSLQEVEQAYDGLWYLQGYAPVKPEPTYEEQRQARANAYAIEVDTITAHIQRLKDQDPIPEGEIAELIAERDAKVQEIKERFPYSGVKDDTL